VPRSDAAAVITIHVNFFRVLCYFRINVEKFRVSFVRVLCHFRLKSCVIFVFCVIFVRNLHEMTRKVHRHENDTKITKRGCEKDGKIVKKIM